MKKNSLEIAAPDIEALIIELHGRKVILDADLARTYGVPTKALNQTFYANSFVTAFAFTNSRGCLR